MKPNGRCEDCNRIEGASGRVDQCAEPGGVDCDLIREAFNLRSWEHQDNRRKWEDHIRELEDELRAVTISEFQLKKSVRDPELRSALTDRDAEIAELRHSLEHMTSQRDDARGGLQVAATEIERLQRESKRAVEVNDEARKTIASLTADAHIAQREAEKTEAVATAEIERLRLALLDECADMIAVAMRGAR